MKIKRMFEALSSDIPIQIFSFFVILLSDKIKKNCDKIILRQIS